LIGCCVFKTSGQLVKDRTVPLHSDLLQQITVLTQTLTQLTIHSMLHTFVPIDALATDIRLFNLDVTFEMAGSGSRQIRTTILPVFCDSKSPRNASTAWSRPSTTVSSYSNLPSANHCPAVCWNSPATSAICSPTVKPCICKDWVTKLLMLSGPGCGSSSLFICEITPQEMIRPNLANTSIAASR